MKYRQAKFIGLIFLLSFSVQLFSQSCANYAITRTTGITYTTIAGTGESNFIWRNIASNQNDDNRSYSVPIGFDFWYIGVRYTTISATLNGAVDFSSSTSDGNLPSGSSPYGSNWSNQFSSANKTMLALAPLYADLWTTGGGTAAIATSLVYKLSGTAPNRVLTIEWINFDHWNSPTNSPYASYNFQVKIYETTGVIEFVYGTMTAALGGTYPLQYACGINNTWAAGAPTAAQLLTQQTANTTTFNNTPKNNLTTVPSSNSQLTFTPPTPTAAPTGLSFTAVTKVGMTLNWTDNATNEVGYVIYNSTDGVNYSFVTQVVANSVSAVISGLYPSTTYYWQVYAVTEGGLSAALTGIQATLPALRIISIITGNWNTATTWDCTCIPTAGDSVIIADGTVVTLDVAANGICYSLTVGQGISGQLTIGSSGTNMTLTVSKDVRVLAGATMTVGTSVATHSLVMGGNLTNNGILDFAPTGTKVCNVTFNRNGNQTISGAGTTTNFNLITLNMGTSNANVLDVASTNFTVLPTNFLTITNGTFKLSTATATLTPFTAATTIPASGGIWLNNAGATISTENTVTLYGYLRVSAGTVNIGNASNENLTSYGGTIIIDGGTVNIAGRLDRAGVTILTFFTMSSGTLQVGIVGSTTAGLAPFMISETGSTFNMSGGTIIIERPGAGNLGYLNTGGTVGSVTGGTLQMGDASTQAAQTMQINSSIPIYNLTVSNGIAVTAQLSTNSLTVKNNVTINSGTLNANALNITLGGNWSNSGTFTPSTGTVTFNGATAQTITGASTTTFNNLTITNSSATGVTLTAPSAAGGILTLTDGFFYTDATNLLTMNAGSSVGAVSNNSFVYGPMAKTGSTNFTFPVGKTAEYRPIGITSLSGSETFTAEYFNSDPNLVPYNVTLKDATLDHISRCEYWILNRATAINAFVTLSWDSYSCGVDNLTDIAVTRWDGAVWRDHGNGGTTGVIDPGTGTVISSAIVTAFSPFTLASKGITNPLPIELLSFTANCNNQNIILKWNTATETNNDFFTIEHSKDGINWQIIDTVDGAGNSSSIRNYSFNDVEQYNEVSYYRLKQTDFDGKFKYSRIIVVENCGENLSELFIYPNPVTNYINVLLTGNYTGIAMIKITDVTGRLVYSREMYASDDTRFEEIDMSDFDAGIYFVSFDYGLEKINKRIIKQ